MRSVHWPVGTYAQDIARMHSDPPPGEGDGRIYIVRNIFGDYIAQVMKGGGLMTTQQRKGAKKFYDGQAAWGAATKSIYPAKPIIVGRVTKAVIEEYLSRQKK